MSYTPHGHHVPGTIKGARPPRVARCGGVRYCQKCKVYAEAYTEALSYLKDPANDATEAEIVALINGAALKISIHNDATLFKAYEALKKSGLTEKQAFDGVNEMLNAGLLIRERG